MCKAHPVKRKSTIGVRPPTYPEISKAKQRDDFIIIVVLVVVIHSALAPNYLLGDGWS